MDKYKRELTEGINKLMAEYISPWTDKDEEDEEKKLFEVEEEIYEYLLEGKEHGMSTDFCLGYYTALHGVLGEVEGVYYERRDTNSMGGLFTFLNKLRDDIDIAPSYAAHIKPSDIAEAHLNEVKETLENLSKAEAEIGKRMEADVEKLKKKTFEEDYPWGIGEYDVDSK